MLDMVGQPIEPGMKAVWANGGYLFFGTVQRVTKKRCVMQAITPDGVAYWDHMPYPEKILIVQELPKQALFWALKG
jgi:hypothetical protein